MSRAIRNHAPRLAYGLFTEDGLDQIAYGQTQAGREARDLRAMGCKVTVIVSEGDGDHESAFEDIAARVTMGLGVGAFTLSRVGCEHDVTLRKAKV